MNKRIDMHHPVTVCKASAGTGKTFTLAAYYIGLLMSGEDYRSILAITFTNKATAEMSERILKNLYEIWHGTVDANFVEAVQSFMFRNRDKDEAWMQARAEWCFKQMLVDFDNVKIQTIDSFLQTLLSGLAGIFLYGIICEASFSESVILNGLGLSLTGFSSGLELDNFSAGLSNEALLVISIDSASYSGE